MTLGKSFTPENEKRILNINNDLYFKRKTVESESKAIDLQVAKYHAMSDDSPERTIVYDEIQKASKQYSVNVRKAADEIEKLLAILLEIVRSDIPEIYELIEAEYTPVIKRLKECAAFWEDNIKNNRIRKI